jgi:hypothetical protein
MTNFKHLTESELSAYHSCSLEKKELNEIGSHLLMCPDCRKRLPLPTVEQFWSAIMTGNDRDENPADEKSKISIGAIFPSVWNLPSSLVWSVGAVMLLFTLSIVIWLGLPDRSNSGRDVAEAFEREVYLKPPDKIREQIISPPMVPPSGKDKTAQPPSNREIAANNGAAPESNQRKEAARLTSQKNTEPKASLRNQVGNKNVISSTRGAADENCSEAASVEMETGTSAESVRLRWRKIPNAVKYHLYVSDDDEILVDEYETERENVYVLKKPLDPAKTYKWKIIITLENGQTIVGDAQKFTVKDLRSDQEIIKRQKKSQVRCSEGN